MMFVLAEDKKEAEAIIKERRNNPGVSFRWREARYVDNVNHVRGYKDASLCIADSAALNNAYNNKDLLNAMYISLNETDALMLNMWRNGEFDTEGLL